MSLIKKGKRYLLNFATNIILGNVADAEFEDDAINKRQFDKSINTLQQAINSIDLSPYAPKASPTFTGIPAAPTASPGTNTTQLATTAFVLANSGSSVTVLTIQIGITFAGFSAIGAGSYGTFGFPFPGAALGDCIIIGLPIDVQTVNVSFIAYAISANEIEIKAFNHDSVSVEIPYAIYNFKIIK